jgi:hypothetical protein
LGITNGEHPEEDAVEGISDGSAVHLAFHSMLATGKHVGYIL